MNIANISHNGQRFENSDGIDHFDKFGTFGHFDGSEDTKHSRDLDSPVLCPLCEIADVRKQP